ncbi:hypothetical protein MMC30_009422 [Trapelia coarctata]|nr:hypothetical protein [Trapelia coarctata]
MASAEPGDDYTIPDDYKNLNEVAGPSPVENPREQRYYRHESLEQSRSRGRAADDYFRNQESLESRQAVTANAQGDRTGSLSEAVVPLPAARADDTTSRTESFLPSSSRRRHATKPEARPLAHPKRASKFATQLYTICYLIFFSILGTLARLGLQVLTLYPGAPVQTGVLWANFAGSVFMGLLSEDRKLFQEEWAPTDQETQAQVKRNDEEHGRIDEDKKESENELAAAKKRHSSVKKTIPLYIGLATGFCGSFTSFSSFIRDVFFAMSNSLPVPVQQISSVPIDGSSVVPRNGGYDFMALLAMILLTVTLCLGGLQGGAHLAIALEPYTPSIPFHITRKYIDRIVVFLALGAWLGAILMAIWPPDRPSGPNGAEYWLQETWRGEVLFALVFAPLGCLLRFYASLRLNARIPSFPLGTFAVNIFGTVMLGMFYDLQHAPLGGVSRGMIGGGLVGCQVLQGCMDGFCGCLTTVSTWVAELKALQRRHAYVYGITSVLVALGFLVVIMGSLKWTVGFGNPACVT